MEIASLYQDLEYKDDKPVIKVLFETSFTKEIRIAMKKGTQMKEHKTSFPIVVEIVEGEINFGIQNQIKNLEKGDLIALEVSIPHSLEAIEDSIVRLTLTKNDEVDR
ncbi:MAG: cupin, partial [Oligoflexus sp.]|nr:cupin [Pseudopedobacter sp.]